jgi:hypothetical protein
MLPALQSEALRDLELKLPGTNPGAGGASDRNAEGNWGLALRHQALRA